MITHRVTADYGITAVEDGHQPWIVAVATDPTMAERICGLLNGEAGAVGVPITAREARRRLDWALLTCMPHAGGAVLKALEQLQRALDDLDAERAAAGADHRAQGDGQEALCTSTQPWRCTPDDCPGCFNPHCWAEDDKTCRTCDVKPREARP